MSTGRFAVCGRFVQGVVGSPGDLEYVEDGCCVVEDGVITKFARTPEEVSEALKDVDRAAQLKMSAAELCCPGMIDTHVHAPQYQFTGTATDLPLMEWLQTYTFPAERRCADVHLASRIYTACVKKLLSLGTTTAVYYASIHLESTMKLADICLALGQRALVGKVCIDRHGGEDYQETTEQAIKETEDLINYCYTCQPETTGHGRLVNPVITPRFIPTCTPKLLQGLGELAAKYRPQGVWVQSHMAETPDEMAYVDSLHPGQRDSAIFDSFGLLTDRCIMAHCVHLNQDELTLCAKRGSGIAHCPLSNFLLSVGDFPLRRAQAAGVRVGLGTDVAGGYSPSMLMACRHAVTMSKVLSRTEGFESTEVDFKLAFWTATLGGAAVIGLEDHLGSFGPGKQFDALLVSSAPGVYDIFPETEAGPSSLKTDFERFVNLGDDRNVRQVYVRGRLVHTAP